MGNEQSLITKQMGGNLMYRRFEEEQKQLQLNLEQRKQALALAMIGPLKSGLQSFNTVAQILFNIDADIILPGCQTFQDIREHIENMKQELEKSEEAVKKELEHLDGDTERLTVEQGILEKQKQESQRDVETLKIKLNRNKVMLEQHRRSLDMARNVLYTAQATLNEQRRKRDEAERIRNAGIGIMFIPVVGWIAGSTMVGVGQTDLNRYSDMVDSARNHMQNCESEFRSYSSSVSGCESDIQKAQQDIQLADCRIRETEATLKNLSEKREVIADVQAKTRGAVRQLGELSVVGSAAELQTRSLILLEPVMRVMEEMTSALGRITGEELLLTEGIMSLVEEMKTNQMKLCDKSE